MAFPYERFEGDVIVEEDDIISSASEDVQSLDRAGVVDGRLVLQGQSQDGDQMNDEQRSRQSRNEELLLNKWPRKIGTVHVAWGILVLILALVQIIVIPIIEDKTSIYWVPRIYKGNYYGISLWTSLLLLLSGSLGLRSSIYQSTCSLYAFVSVILFEVLLYPVFIIIILVAYSSHWVDKGSFPHDSMMFYVTVMSSVAIVVGFLFVLLAFTQYYEEVFCGEVQLCRRCIHRCMPCWCPRAISQSELYDEDSTRPPSIPV